MKRGAESLPRLLKAIGSGIRAGWAILGLTLILVVAYELGLRLVFGAKDNLVPTEEWAPTDAYRGAEWVQDYIRENAGVGQYVWHPYVYWRRPSHEGRYINVNPGGLRATWNPPPRDSIDAPSPPVRLFIFGGSTMWGWGARDDYTIASHLSKLLHERGYRAQVTNYGETAYVNTQEVITLLRCIHRGQVPDIALFYDGLNDVLSSHDNHEAGIPQFEQFRREEYNLRQRPEQLQRMYLEQFLFRNFPGIQRLGDRWRRYTRPPEDAGPLSNRVARQTVHVYESNLALVESLGQRHGFDALFYWQPIIYSKRHRSPDEQAWAERYSRHRQAFEDLYPRIRQSEFLDGHPRFHDISSLFDDLEVPYYVDFWHLSEAGNRLVAEAMVDDVIELIEQRRAGTGTQEKL